MNIKSREYVPAVREQLAQMNANGRMTVAYFIDSYFPLVDGVVSVLHNYATHLKDRINVIVCAPAHKKEQVDQDYLVVSSRSFYFGLIHYDCAMPKGDRQLKQLLSEARIDLIHLHSPFLLGAYGLKLARERGIPVVATFHSQYKKDFINYTHSKLLASILLKKIMKVFKGVDCVYTMHESSRNTLISYGYRGAVRRLPNATNETYAEHPEELIARVNRQFGLEGKQNVLLFVGRLTRVKNIFFILEILDLLMQRNFPFHMVFVGDGPDEKPLKKQAEESGLSERITFTGSIRDRELLKGLYLRSDLFLFPSCYDVSSIVQIEAASQKLCGLFVSGSVTSCTIQDNVTGFLCEEDSKKFADKIVEIFSDPEKLERVSQQAYEKLYVNWDMLVERILPEYQDIIRQYGGKAEAPEPKVLPAQSE